SSGSRQRLRNLFEALATIGDVHILLVGHLEPGEADAIAAWGVASVEVIEPEAVRASVRTTLSWLAGLGPIDGQRKLNVDAVRARVDRRLQELRAAVVFAPGTDAEAYLPETLGCPLIVDVSAVEDAALSRTRRLLMRELH